MQPDYLHEASRSHFPRALTGQELAWLDFLLPADRPGYAEARHHLDGLLVLGEGRWGAGDFILGNPAGEIDPTEGMRPVVSYGELAGHAADGKVDTITLAIHEPNSEGLVEFQVASVSGASVPEGFVAESRWSYSYWSPGENCPATGEPVREIPLNDASDLLLVISPAKRVLWMFDAVQRTSRLIPVTNFYNELMLLKGIRDPSIAFDHHRLFTGMNGYADSDLRAAYIRYNNTFRKVDPMRLEVSQETPQERPSLMRRIMRALGGRS
jgi:hypothetical protein